MSAFATLRLPANPTVVAPVALEPGVCLTIPVGTHFQFRASASQAIAAVAVTMPPWPGGSEAIIAQGRREPSVA